MDERGSTWGGLSPLSVLSRASSLWCPFLLP